MPPRLCIECPEWAGAQDPDDAGAWENETPRSPLAAPGSLPSSPSARKTKSRAARAHRINSLKDAKVLVVTDMHRSESALDPALFQYHQHFESPWQLVGKTHLSEVFRVRHRASGEVFAVKRSRRRFRSKLQRERCLREIRAVAALPAHPNIVNQYRAWQEGGHFYIQMDFCEGGTLGQRAHKACTMGTCMPDDALWAVTCQAAQGLAFLHSHGVMHLDIKPDNIYFSAAGLPKEGSTSSNAPCCAGCSGGTWRIGDFGLAVARGQDGSMDWEEGDGDYVAPELLQAGGEPSERADIFSLGASLFECATGHKLPRSEGWGEGSAAAVKVPHRPAAFVELLRVMLQANPAMRPTAQQVTDVVAREQPAIAAAAAEAVAAAAAAAAVAEAAAAAARAAATMPVQQGTVPAGSPLAPSPFQQAVAGSSSVTAGDAAAPAAATDAVQFSFDVPAAKRGGFAFTPSQPLRRPSKGGPPGTAVKGTPAGRTRLGEPSRWAPALSPLISEGALTPGALAALAGLTPQASKGDPTPTLFGAPASSGSSGSRSRSHTVAATPLDACRPAPLQLPQSTAQAVPSAGTSDSRDGWRLSRRDIISPDSDVLNGSHSESDYSYSCGTGRTMSDMDFADALSPMSQELHLSFATAGATPSTGTPESLPRQLDEEGADPPSTGLRPPHEGEHGLIAAAQQRAASLQHAPSLAWDLHTSPEFLMQLPPGSPASLSHSSSLDDCASLPPSRAMSVRRFPTLDSWGSALDVSAGANGKPPAGMMQHCDSLTAVAAQHFTNTFPAAGQAERGGPAMPPLVGRGLRKRQHSSRRTLMAALSRDNSVASSIDGMQPMGKQQRHVADPDSAGPSPNRVHPMADMPSLPLRPLPRSGSVLGRDAVAAAAAMAEVAAKALAAAVPQDMVPASAFAAQQVPPLFACSGEQCGSNEGRPPSPLHTRMTCMKLRDTD